MDMKMTNDNVLIRPEEAVKSKGGIIIPESATKKERPSKGIILKVGEHRSWSGEGEKAPMPYKPGQQVVYHAYPQLAIEDPENVGRDLYIIAEKQIVGVLEGGK